MGRMGRRARRTLGVGAAAALLIAVVSFGMGARDAAPAQGETFDVVIANGRVMDPESRLDAVRSVGISGGKIRAISSGAL